MSYTPDASHLSTHPSPWDTAFDDHARRWAAHVAARRIGAAPVLSPAQAATHAANDALFRARAARQGR